MEYKTIKEINNMIDYDFIINKLAFALNKTKEDILKDISLESIKNITGTILYNRNIFKESSIDKVINNLNTSINDPKILTNAEKASKIIYKYCTNPNSIIFVFGDYDVDGVTAGYVMTSGLRDVSMGPVYIQYPDRSEGYGLSMEFCEKVIATKNETNKEILVITVDNGITKTEEVNFLQQNNIEVIITDHHKNIDDNVPKCIIVDPHNDTEEQNKNTKCLCGCGVAFKICQILHEMFNKYDMLYYTQFLALATLADVMILNEENIAFIQYGLDILNTDNCHKGLKTLIKENKIDFLTANDILWTLAPMINACGRMGNVTLASDLFFIDNNSPIQNIVSKIISNNKSRKTSTKNALKEIEKIDFKNNKVCITHFESYPNGILGIIAGKVAETYNKPAIIGHVNKENVFHGSIRSANGIDMFTLLEDMNKKNLINSYGGHAMACVCSFNMDNINKINEYFNNVITEKLYNIVEEQQEIKIDMDIKLKDLNLTVFTLVNLLIPYDNKQLSLPMFNLKDIEVAEYSLSKSNPNNIKFIVKQNGKCKIIWAWGFANKYINELKEAKKINIVGTLNKCFLTQKYVLNVTDIGV